MINEKINKSFLNIISPPFLFRSLAITQLLNVPNIIILQVNLLNKKFNQKNEKK